MIRKTICVYLCCVLFAVSVVKAAEGSFLPSEAIAVSPGDREADIDRLRAALENRLVGQRLEDLGMDPAQAKARLAELGDEELHFLATHLDALNPGGDGLGFAIGLVVLAILVVLLIKLMDREIIVR